MDIVNVPSYDIPGLILNFFDFIFGLLPSFIPFIQKFLSYMVVISLPLSIMLLIGIIVSIERVKTIRKKEEEIYNKKVEMGYNEIVKGDPEMSFRWKRIVEHMESQNKNDWRQAIMEADIILGEILDKMGYQGEGIGEKLRRVEKADFHTLDQAWEAHKIRNIIAHEGASYDLTQYEAKRVSGLYKQVFEEFFYI